MDNIKFRYEINPELNVEQITNLRESVGWNKMHEYYQKIIGKSYFNIGCFLDNQLIGYIDVLSDGVIDAYIRDLMVIPNYQRKGIGSQLLTIAINKIREDKICSTNILFDNELTKFYKKAGFYIISGGVINN